MCLEEFDFLEIFLGFVPDSLSCSLFCALIRVRSSRCLLLFQRLSLIWNLSNSSGKSMET